MVDQIQPKLVPELSIPVSDSIVFVQAIDTTMLLSLDISNFVEPSPPGHQIYDVKAVAFLITNQKTGRKVLFDFGIRKDYWNGPPVIVNGLKDSKNVKGIKCGRGVQDVLVDAGEKLEDIEAVIWSHYHFDHTGDPSTLPTTVKLVVGPGFREKCLPGYPSNPKSPVLQSDYALSGRELKEISFDGSTIIGAFQAYDYFGDGSFYLLDVPGHAVGHMCGLARTTSDTFVLLGGDACHLIGALRPTDYTPLPLTIDITKYGLDSFLPNPCPCTTFTAYHPAATDHDKRTTPYYKASSAPGSVYSFPDIANQSIHNLKQFDANEHVLVCMAHDPSLLEVLPVLNSGNKEMINNWKLKGWKESLRWRFLNDLPRPDKSGDDPEVYGFWRDGKLMSAEDALERDKQ